MEQAAREGRACQTTMGSAMKALGCPARGSSPHQPLRTPSRHFTDGQKHRRSLQTSVSASRQLLAALATQAHLKMGSNVGLLEAISKGMLKPGGGSTPPKTTSSFRPSNLNAQISQMPPKFHPVPQAYPPYITNIPNITQHATDITTTHL